LRAIRARSRRMAAIKWGGGALAAGALALALLRRRGRART
jgi:hypothetical protein